MRRLPVFLLAVATLSSLAFAASDAAADPAEKGAAAAALIEQGIDLRQAAHDAEALALFERAQALSPSPRGEAQVGLAEQALGRWVRAEEHLGHALGAKDDSWIESKRAILDHAKSVIQAHLGDVELVGLDAGAVYIDGVAHDEASTRPRLRLEIGRRTLEVRWSGSYPFSRVLDVGPEEVVRVEVERHPLLATASTVTADHAPPPPNTALPAGGGGHTQRTVAWAFAGGTGLAAVAGIIGVAVRGVAVADFNGNSQCPGQSHQCQSWYNEGTTAQDVEIAGFVGAGVLAATSLVLFLTAPSSKPAEVRAGATTLTFPCSASRSGAWCGVGATF